MKAWPRLIGDPRTVERLFSRLPDPEVVDESEDWSSAPKVGLVSLITVILEKFVKIMDTKIQSLFSFLLNYGQKRESELYVELLHGQFTFFSLFI